MYHRTRGRWDGGVVQVAMTTSLSLTLDCAYFPMDRFSNNPSPPLGEKLDGQRLPSSRYAKRVSSSRQDHYRLFQLWLSLTAPFVFLTQWQAASEYEVG